MSAPPISSPPTKTCGIVGQLEMDGELLADGRVGQYVDRGEGRADGAKSLERPLGVAAHALFVGALDEGDDGLGVDRLLDPVAQVAHASPRVVMRSSWIVPSASGSASAS